jgi:hypothetical protein
MGTGKGKPPVAAAAGGEQPGSPASPASAGGTGGTSGGTGGGEEMTLRADLGAAEWSKLQELVAVQVRRLCGGGGCCVLCCVVCLAAACGGGLGCLGLGCR